MPLLKITAIKKALSSARMGTYENATDSKGDKVSVELAMELYAWNAQVAAAFLAPLHICEVVIRNAVAEALENKYGARWPWSPAFERSLPDPIKGYSPRKDLQTARRTNGTTGKVIPELKFAFWQSMFTGRHDSRLWNTYLTQVLPNLPGGQPIQISRQTIFNELEHIRKLRNRIAHHEPIFSRNLTDDFQKTSGLIALRCALTNDWMKANQQALDLVGMKPV